MRLWRWIQFRIAVIRLKIEVERLRQACIDIAREAK